MSTERALQKLAARGIEIKTVLDVGASNGMWSDVCQRHFPDADYLLIEAQRVHREALEAYRAAHPRADYVLAAAGDVCGEIYFDDTDPFGGLASKVITEDARTIVPQTTLDHEVAARGLQGPYLLKLDTHGYELPILEGARRNVMPQAEIVVIETYNFRQVEGSLCFHEMVAFMRDKGFGVFDLSEPLWRMRDGAFWQIDFFFVPLSRPEFASDSYA